MHSKRNKNLINASIAMSRQMLKCCFILTFVIAGLRYTANHKNGLSYILLLRLKRSLPYYHYRTMLYTAGLDY